MWKKKKTFKKICWELCTTGEVWQENVPTGCQTFIVWCQINRPSNPWQQPLFTVEDPHLRLCKSVSFLLL